MLSIDLGTNRALLVGYRKNADFAEVSSCPVKPWEGLFLRGSGNEENRVERGEQCFEVDF